MLLDVSRKNGNDDSAISTQAWLRRAIHRIALLSVMSLVGFATTASAWTYTLIDPITIDDTNNAGTMIRGTINLVTNHRFIAAPTGAKSAGVVNTLMDTNDKTYQDFVWFSITLDVDSAPVEQLQASIVTTDFGTNPLGNPVGAGFASCGGCIDPAATVSPPAPAVSLPPFAIAARWNFGLGDTVNHLEANDTSADLLWVGELLVGGQGTINYSAISFMIQGVGGAAFNVLGVVPEPSTALLLGLGLCGMSISRRRTGNRCGARKSA